MKFNRVSESKYLILLVPLAILFLIIVIIRLVSGQQIYYFVIPLLFCCVLSVSILYSNDLKLHNDEIHFVSMIKDVKIEIRSIKEFEYVNRRGGFEIIINNESYIVTNDIINFENLISIMKRLNIEESIISKAEERLESMKPIKIYL